MINQYQGNFLFNDLGVTLSAPDSIGVYYCGSLDATGALVPQYIGRAMGSQTSIRSRLLDHLREDRWHGVSHFGFRVCSTASEAIELERQEIANFQPQYNTIGTAADLSPLARAMLQASKRL